MLIEKKVITIEIFNREAEPFVVYSPTEATRYDKVSFLFVKFANDSPLSKGYNYSIVAVKNYDLTKPPTIKKRDLLTHIVHADVYIPNFVEWIRTIPEITILTNNIMFSRKFNKEDGEFELYLEIRDINNIVIKDLYVSNRDYFKLCLFARQFLRT